MLQVTSVLIFYSVLEPTVDKVAEDNRSLCIGIDKRFVDRPH